MPRRPPQSPSRRCYCPRRSAATAQIEGSFAAPPDRHDTPHAAPKAHGIGRPKTRSHKCWWRSHSSQFGHIRRHRHPVGDAENGSNSRLRRNRKPRMNDLRRRDGDTTPAYRHPPPPPRQGMGPFGRTRFQNRISTAILALAVIRRARLFLTVNLSRNDRNLPKIGQMVGQAKSFATFEALRGLRLGPVSK